MKSALLVEASVPSSRDFPIIFGKEEDQVILDLFVYLWNKYDEESRGEHFSASRATKLIFLVDWYYSRHNKNNWEQVTKIPWYYNTYGPYVNLISIVEREFKVNRDSYKTQFELNEGTNYSDSLTEDMKEICDMVINDTEHLRYFGFINYVYSTTAVALSERGEIINIPEIAKEFYNET